MTIGFRKSLFGFNSEDVVEYIEKTHKKFSKKEKELNEKIDELNSSVDNANKAINELTEQKEELLSRLKEFTEKKEEMENLSKNIGKLYLVAEANAKSVMENSKASSELAMAEVSKNLSAINIAQDSLNDLKADIINATSHFSSELDRLIEGFNQTKTDINLNTAEIESRVAEFNTVLKNVNR